MNNSIGEDVPTTADIDWSRQDVPAGATHYAIQDGVVTWLKDDYSFWNVWEDGAWAACGIPVAQPIPTTPEPQVDWSAAPEGATHWHKDEFVRWTGKRNPVFGSWDMDGWLGGEWLLAHWGWQGTLETFLADGAIPRPKPITDTRKDPVLEMARSIEAARVAEKSEGVINFADLVLEDPAGSMIESYNDEMKWPDGDARYFETSDVPETKKYPHYFKDVSAVDAIDLYHVARLYHITDPALFHAFKKIACAGKRGAKDQAQDVQEAIDALKRWQELNA